MRLFIDALWSPAGKGLISWLSFVMPNCEVVTFPFGILGQVWCLIVSIPDFCPLSYFYYESVKYHAPENIKLLLSYIICSIFFNGKLYVGTYLLDRRFTY